ncbi:ABC transporter substrate-binding protein, partial [Bradyrhizobium sp. AS23.2]|uniref:ABC transporter substrate-binding protein n=1 Tax=Bradyrhizobium sp. AS23.2 TaxID=1680155 RepID=UPI001AD7EAE1
MSPNSRILINMIGLLILGYSTCTAEARAVKVGVLSYANAEPYRALLESAFSQASRTGSTHYEVQFRSSSLDQREVETMATELARTPVDVIVAYPTPAAVAARLATKSIPIVMMGVADPVGTGLVASLSRPGGNVTGTSATTDESSAKTLELARDILGELGSVSVLANRDDPFTPTFIRQLEAAARVLGAKLSVITIGEPMELAGAFESMHNLGEKTVVVQPTLPRDATVQLALKYKMGAFSPTASFVRSGGLASYSAKPEDIVRR